MSIHHSIPPANKFAGFIGEIPSECDCHCVCPELDEGSEAKQSPILFGRSFRPVSPRDDKVKYLENLLGKN